MYCLYLVLIYTFYKKNYDILLALWSDDVLFIKSFNYEREVATLSQKYELLNYSVDFSAIFLLNGMKFWLKASLKSCLSGPVECLKKLWRCAVVNFPAASYSNYKPPLLAEKLPKDLNSTK